MMRKLDDAVERWLAEEAGETASAEARLSEVFQRLTPPRPPRGFAMAVLRRAGLARRRDVFANTWVHVAIAAALLLSGLAVAFLPAVARIARLLLAPADFIAWASRGVVSASRVLAGALDVWGFMSRLGNALGTAVATPQVALTLILVALCAGGALRALDRLITAERSL